MVFNKFVEIGRVVFINYGPDYGKLAVIIDVVDQNRALVDGPSVNRHQLVFKRMTLTPLKMSISRCPRRGTLLKAWEKDEVESKWSSTSFAKKIAKQQSRASLTDFGRFQVLMARKQKAFQLKKELSQLKKAKQ
ncbi:hypothetical protein BVRB_042710 [Beta vulgaris subsp. vulgaris]|uniref:Large ribosomal subunit protein eL14 domain-containing protein n=1 Tax=Beta vulgaris subsp. vulgaris TaxID=3555 RepID=A0A0J7YNS5_BETVV|nr:hypothetical protein BVRB_042710 [Beta vulgaris subsp. vulgaris]